MYKLIFYSPLDHADIIKAALFEAGAGKIGEYSCCAWQTLGEGQFMPLDDSNAFIGEKNKVEKVPELKIELVCDEKFIQAAVSALKKTHPYETPAYQVFKMENF